MYSWRNETGIWGRFNDKSVEAIILTAFKFSKEISFSIPAISTYLSILYPLGLIVGKAYQSPSTIVAFLSRI